MHALSTRTHLGSGLAAAQRTRQARRHAAPWVIAALAGILYAWGIGHGQVQPFYTAAVRSMALSWKAFFFGGLDPSAAITLDKTPGTFWLQALSVRTFGPHLWAVELPQVLEGMGAVLVLHRAVHEWAGQAAAALAALALALTPIVVALDRDNLPDTLLILLLVLAARDMLRAVALEQPRRRTWLLLRAGLWIGLAFQAKMMQAWLILPALLLPYLVAAAAPLRRRLADALGMLAVTAAVSLSWVAAVWCVPAADRPWIDGSAANNPFAMVFLYNGVGRFGLGGGLQAQLATAAAPRASLGWKTLVSATYAGQISWLLPFAGLALLVWLFEHRRNERTDPVRAGYLLWGGWLLVYAVVTSVAGSMHGYYLAVLAPPVCALFGGGLIHRWQTYSRHEPLRWVLPAGIALSTLWAVYLGANYTRFLPLLPWVVGPLGLAAACVLALLRPVRRPADEERAVAVRGRPALRSRVALSASAAGAVLALLASPAGWSASALSPAYASTSGAPMAGPAGTLYAPVALEHRALPVAYALVLPVGRDRKLLAYLREHQGTEKYLAATQAAAIALPFLRAGSGDFLVLGGFTGLTPNVTAAQFATLVADDTVRFALLSAGTRGGPASGWIARHCLRVAPEFYRERTDDSVQLYDCRPAA